VDSRGVGWGVGVCLIPSNPLALHLPIARSPLVLLAVFRTYIHAKARLASVPDPLRCLLTGCAGLGSSGRSSPPSKPHPIRGTLGVPLAGGVRTPSPLWPDPDRAEHTRFVLACLVGIFLPTSKPHE
jgi:hypothetical protein